jgi:hypothetical protein
MASMAQQKNLWLGKPRIKCKWRDRCNRYSITARVTVINQHIAIGRITCALPNPERSGLKSVMSSPCRSAVVIIGGFIKLVMKKPGGPSAILTC